MYLLAFNAHLSVFTNSIFILFSFHLIFNFALSRKTFISRLVPANTTKTYHFCFHTCCAPLNVSQQSFNNQHVRFQTS